MNFDLLARHYRWMEAVLAGGTLQRARVRWLDALEGRTRVLIVGEGPGRLLEAVLRRFPRVEVTVVEQSAAMIDVARRRLRTRGVALGRVCWEHADVREWVTRGAADGARPRGFEAVLTPFVLDCFASEDLARVVGRLGDAAAEEAIWLLTDFAMPERGWRRARARAVHALMYWFFGFATQLEAVALTRPDEALKRAGFVLKRRAVFNAGLVQSDEWQRGGCDETGGRAEATL